MRIEVTSQYPINPVFGEIVRKRRKSHFDDFASNQFVFDPIPVLVEFLGQRQELIGREEGSRRHRYYSSARALDAPAVVFHNLIDVFVLLGQAH